MSNPTRQEIIKAHEALTHLIDYDLADAYTEADTEEVYEREQLLRKFLPPRPRPTMAEIEWDNDKHYMAEAEVGEIKLIMLQSDLIGRIRCFDPESGKVMPAIEPEDVIPTGRRYVLMED